MAQVQFHPTGQYNLLKSGRAFSPEDIENEEKAEKLPLSEYHRIAPVPGTLGFLFRNFEGGNDSVITFFENSLKRKRGGSSVLAGKIVIKYKSLDNWSRKRVDIFDWLCIELHFDKINFWEYVQGGVFEFQDALSKIALNGLKPSLIDEIWKNAKKENGYKDRALMAKIAGLDQQVPQTQIIDNRKTTVKNELNVSASGSQFSSLIRGTEKKIIAKKPEPRQLEEGNKEDFVEAEYVLEDNFIREKRK